jgi:tetratricopeptide (TPR) repeat protein
MRSLLVGVALLVALSVDSLVDATHAQVPSPASDAEIDVELPEVLNAARDETALDRIDAQALFAQARILEQRRERLAALRRYQRAYRYDPRQTEVLKRIVSLALEVGRSEEAGRYATLAPGDGLGDLLTLRRLALDATNRNDWRLAAKLYEQSLAHEDVVASKSATSVLIHAELGRLHFLSEDFARSWEHFEIVSQALKSPDEYGLSESLRKIIVGKPREMLSLMARAALEAQQLDEAERLFREAYADEPEGRDAVVAEAQIAFHRGELALAREKLASLLEQGKIGDATPLELLRRIAAKEHEGEKLAAHLAETLQQWHVAHPENETLRRELARAYAEQEKLDEAERLLTDDAVKDPSSQLKRQLAALQRRRQKSDAWLQTVSHLAVAETLSAVDDEVKSAAADEPFAAALLAHEAEAVETPQQQMAERIIALVALERKQPEIALERWERALPAEQQPKAESLLMLSLRLLQADHFDRSAALLQRILADKLLDADNPVLQFYLSGAAVLAGRQEEALEAARKAAALRRDDIRYAAREAWVLYHLDRLAEARDKYQALIGRFEKSSDSATRAALLESRLILSALHEKLEERAAAIEQLESVLDEHPEHVGAMNDLAYLWSLQAASPSERKHLQRALGMVQKAVAADPKNKAYRDTLGWVLFQLERFPEAVEELQQAAEGDSPGGVVLDHLGDALHRVGRTEEAQTAWRRAVEAFGEEESPELAAAVERKLADTAE